ncbi:MAG TPA: precorrin-6A/cobalt-precorrin-6A reductase, partial [Pseudonocardiaceae bacterium]
RTERISAVIDATHPFAATMPRHTERACLRLGLPLLVLRRPGWTGDWLRVPTIRDVPALIRAQVPEDGCVFLTTGRGELAVLAEDTRHRYLVRMVDQPAQPLPPRTQVLLARGPYTVDEERELMREHQVVLLVTKDSGGASTSAKLTAADELGVAVLMVSRPPLPEGVLSVGTVAEALAWLDSLVDPGSTGG